MFCQRCHERPATVHLTKVINHQKTELHLCEICAKEAGSELGLIFESSFSFQNLIAGLLEGDTGHSQQPSIAGHEIQCQNCGLTFTDFRRGGLLGCGECYRYFQQGLEPLLKKVHGSIRHTGKVPRRNGGKIRIRKEIDDLRNRLQESIRREDYEKAAYFRDEIKRRENELAGG
ncbi:protein arginine kinase activator [Hydrogenispora ethanolica]|uniref:Protein arginine kinase activator n=1 Tax=Hydrogenispora ethanolica TaxID=1082276 RepID=A0A4R1R8I7_HYDET|nr:protein arginine kinase activator [Hydrogenispora ethanolica]